MNPPPRHTPLLRPLRAIRAKRRPFLRRRARRHAEADKLYRKLARGFKKAHPRCFRCLGGSTYCNRPTTDVHHRAGRGPYLNDTSLWLPVCRRCHRWIHDHPKEAEFLGNIIRNPPPPQPHDPKYLT